MSVTPGDVVAFWGDAGRDKWFNKDDNFDRSIVERFSVLHAEAASGRKQDWTKTPEGTLALILVLDQFSRNMFRGTPKAFAQDEVASGIALQALDAKFDEAVPPDLRMFFYMPLMHSERLADQERCVRLFHGFAPGGLKFARDHEEIIRRFGRFPHRNSILGRHTTPSEKAFLDGGGFAG